MEGFRYLDEVATLHLDKNTCVGCGMCTIVCPHTVFVVEDQKARILDRDACMECGACKTNCPVEAIKVDAGVGCAAAVINAALGRKGGSCCCVVESRENTADVSGCSEGASASVGMGSPAA